ncbi:site-specific integrase [Actinopolymorpha sp. NPDC004070]|uniref:site-specific integrase n=1 Tax=Actinopolymorpha sp. NPDC004070 TaxID=3154548 RepID=UPI00339EFD21
MAARGDHGLDWMDDLAVADPRSGQINRAELGAGLNWLFLARVLQPGYDFFSHYKAFVVFELTPKIISPDLFTQFADVANAAKVSDRDLGLARRALVKITLHTGRDLDGVTSDDFAECQAWGSRHKRIKGLHVAWDLLAGVGVFGKDTSLRDSMRTGQQSTSDLVDFYRIRSRSVRDVLVRYLEERRPGMDYNSLRGLAGSLAGTFWADIEQHHPGIDDLRLPEPVAQAWKERLHVVTTSNGSTRARRSRLEVLTVVRAFYLDIQEWAHADPSWAMWAAPSPVRRGDTGGIVKARQQVSAQMHQRIRERLPQVPILVETAERHRADQRDLLQAATKMPAGGVFEHSGRRYRVLDSAADTTSGDCGKPGQVVVEETSSGDTLDLSRAEDEAFWSWAIIETLRHTGVRIEELLEVTHLALVSYHLPDTAELVPLLQVVPSKSNEERLLLISPELASVFATIITRLRRHNGGTVPLVSRYDGHERLTGPALPHLFQRRVRRRSQVISYNTVHRLLNSTVALTGLRDAAGQPLNFTAHDFRRIFTTEAVTGGLPVHIAARLLGHHSLSTTQAYLAVFQDDLIRTYRGFLDARRAVRPPAEYREPTNEEWREFQQHFELRKLELGTCGRPYGTPCQHEHACIRCPMLRLDPKQRGRLVEIIRNLTDRIAEARMNGWHGEAQGLHTSLEAARNKLATLDRSRHGDKRGVTDLATPVIRRPDPSADSSPLSQATTDRKELT